MGSQKIKIECCKNKLFQTHIVLINFYVQYCYATPDYIPKDQELGSETDCTGSSGT